MADMTRPGYKGDDAAQTAQDMLRADFIGQLIRCFDAILKRQDTGVWADYRPYRFCSVPDLPRFDPQKGHINLTDRGWIICRLCRRNQEIAQDAVNTKTVRLDRPQVISAGDENDIVPRLGEPSTEIATNTASAEHRNAHKLITFRGIIRRQSMLNDPMPRRNGVLGVDVQTGSL